jgi:hypothetical protein
VFHIEDHEIQPACSKHLPNARSKEFKHHLAQNNVALAEALPKGGH